MYEIKIKQKAMPGSGNTDEFTKGPVKKMLRRNRNRISLTDEEKNIIINGLLNWRNELIREGRYTDAIDDLRLKLLD